MMEALGTAVLPSNISTIFAGRFQNVCKERAALPSDKRLVHGVHYFLEHIVLGVDHIPSSEQGILVVVTWKNGAYLAITILHPS